MQHQVEALTPRAAALLLVLAACSQAERADAPDAALVCSTLEPLSQAALRRTVEALAAPALEGRAPGTTGDATARALIAARFDCLGLEAPGGTREQAVDADEGATTANVLAIVRGSDPEVADEVIVVGAHHDHLDRDERGIYAGANDNASGVGVMLALAETVAARPSPPRRTIVFTAFGAEEQGYYGSLAYVADPPSGAALEDTVFMVNLDMVGTYAEQETLYALHAFAGTPGRSVLETLVPASSLNVELGDEGERADHLSFCEVGVPTTFFFTEDTRCYHAPCDTADRLDYPGLAQTARLVSAMLTELADGDLDLSAAREGGCGHP